MKRSLSLLLIPALLFLFHETSFAQMFSVDDSSPAAQTTRVSSLTAGWEVAGFQFKGGDEVSSTNRFDFSSTGVFRFHFENPGINLYMGVAGGLTGMEDQNYINIGAVLFNDFQLTGDETFSLVLPLQLNTDYVRTRTDVSPQQFEQTAFQIGAGLGVVNRLTDRFQVEARFIPSYGFSNSQGAFIGGTVYSLDGKARLHIRDVLGNSGLSIGYDFRYRGYDIDRDMFDYDLHGHTFTAGIHF